MSNVDRYLRPIESVTGYRRNLARFSKVTGNQSTLLGSSALASHAQAAPSAIEWGIPTAAGLAAGVIIGAKHGHWLLGAASGASLFTNVPHLLKPETRAEAFWNIVQTHAGCAVSLAMKENKAAGFVLGYIGLGIVRYMYGGGR